MAVESMTEHGWYAERLEEEQEQLKAVKDALGAFDVDGLTAAAGRIGNRVISKCAKHLAESSEVRDVLNALEALEGFLKARIEHLKPLAAEERAREERRAKSEHEQSV